MADAVEASATRSVWKRLIGEFLIIVAGVLVALGVDDLRQNASDRQLASYLLTRVLQDLDADLFELERVKLRAERKIWLTNALLRGLGDAAAGPETPYPEGTADGCRPTCDPQSPEFRPLNTLGLTTQFDLTDAAYQEMLSTSSLRVLDDFALREALSTYYANAAENAGADRRFGLFHEPSLDALEATGLAVTDSVDLDGLIRRLAAYPSFRVTLRRIRFNVQGQLNNYLEVQRQAEALREILQR